MKKRIFDIIQIGEKDDSASRIFDLFIVCVILVHIAVLFIATFDGRQNIQGCIASGENGYNCHICRRIFA